MPTQTTSPQYFTLSGSPFGKPEIRGPFATRAEAESTGYREFGGQEFQTRERYEITSLLGYGPSGDLRHLYYEISKLTRAARHSNR